MKNQTEIYMCVYCDNRVIEGACNLCNEYKSVLTFAEWKEQKLEHLAWQSENMYKIPVGKVNA
jgi:hypothetical protein